MNERLKELYQQAHMVRKYPDDDPMRGGNPPTVYWGERSPEKFALLIVKECIQQCNQEWYDLNNSPKENLDDRGIAIQIGQKSGVLKIQHRLKKHFGVE